MLKTTTKNITMSALLVMACTTMHVNAEQSGNVDLSFQIKTNHLWHGFIVTPSIMTAGELTYITASGNTKFGLWAGASFDGEYQEFTYFASHQFSEQLFVEIVNHGNHSSIDDVDIFNYSSDPTKTGNFTDIGLGYTFAGDMPLSLYYSVIVQGVDKFEDEYTGRRERAYTNYIEANLPVWQGKDGETVTVFVGGAFSPTGDKNFYDDSANIVNLGFSYTKNLQILDYNLPVSATAMWNPALQNGALQVAFSFF
ncbi:hypothetical protein [Paraglaciecola hydrolytica]|uniref:Uncharacterized protein n=1 Tax=Paraglaciecola hydrolytica TaxID=1799789 RepID=A0A135ZYY5_9ALTE|nr:hypothetical protein [Paraglaciecola hydrolytica]KXI28090.1 hypothetical protein AX660_17030 [Paraglaciecola hydrolytica]